MRINSILPDYIAGDGGPSFVCHHLLDAFSTQGIDVCLYCVSGDKSLKRSFHFPSMPHWAQPIGYRLIPDDAWAKFTEWRYLRSLEKADIAYMWTTTSIETYRTAWESGYIILAESVNTHQATSKLILDAEFQRLGLTPAHGIDERSIANESSKLAFVDFVFSPSGEVAKSLINSGVPEAKIIRTSYGLRPVDILSHQAVAGRDARTDLTAIFVGRIGIRKGVHLLLEYWSKAGVKGRLKLIGNIEPSARHLIEPHLNRNGVEHVPFTRDLKSEYLDADVFIFPSLEEGSPLVTYLALGAGLPSLVSPMGGDGIVNHGVEGLIIEPHNEDEWIDSIRRIFSDEEFRKSMARRAYARAENFLWKNVGARRAASLQQSLANRVE